MDTTPPLIKLLGYGPVVSGPDGGLRMVHQLELGRTWEEPGISISDNMDPQLNISFIQLFGGSVNTWRCICHGHASQALLGVVRVGG